MSAPIDWMPGSFNTSVRDRLPLATAPSPSLADRLATAVVSAVIMAIMAIGAPLGLLVLTRGKVVQVVGAYLSFAQWGSAVIAAAALTGLALGSERTTVLFGYLWLTERPRRALFSALLWLALFVIGFVGYSLLPASHVL